MTYNNKNDRPAINQRAAQYLTSTQVMGLLGFRNRAAFWAAVHRESIPCIRITARKILFPESALNDFLARRSNINAIC